MAGRIVQEMRMFPFEFIAPLVVDVEETAHGVAIIKGTLLAEGVSRNGNVYTIAEMKKIAAQAVGMPMYVGTMTKMDPISGITKKHMHRDVKEHRVGRILEAWFHKASRTIKYVAELINTTIHPKIIQEVKIGWGVSIGGVAHKAQIILDQFGRILTKILGMKLDHIQLLPPTVITGQGEAKVEEMTVQETMAIMQPMMTLCCDIEKGICKLKLKSPIPIEVTHPQYIKWELQS